jgi:hypothetical protein
VLEEAPLTGISSYRQREPEVAAKLEELSKAGKPTSPPDLGDPGEY